MTSRRLSTRMQDTVREMESAVCRGRGTEEKVERSGRGAVGPRKQQRLKRAGEYLVRDGSCLSPEEIVKGTDT